jgi:molybdopterin-guanine dinucleotide biosynthesis protein A
MGGGDKGLRSIGGKTILARVIEVMQPQCAGLVLNANGAASRFASFGLPVVADTVPGFAGPLAGVLAGLDWLAEHRPEIEYCLSVPSDTPFLPKNLAARLMEARQAADAELAYAVSGGSSHPVIALWPVDLRHDLRHALCEENLHKVGAFTRRYKVADCIWPGSPIDPFFNANEPQDIIAAQALLDVGAVG